MAIGRTNRHARSLRRNATDAERKVWRHVRNRRLGGFKFRQQATAGYHVVDFLCAEKRLVVELDGGQHAPEVDAERTARLEALGYRVIRFWNNDVLLNTDGVLQTILRELETMPSRFVRKVPLIQLRLSHFVTKSPYPSPARGRSGRTLLLPLVGEG